ncbi:MAG: FlxA-like family protein [Bacteroidales bacterium]|nr:FlxA-like family protein [Bacteroidales bacterium]MCM1415169.1 FlxA-like family protein [bacterium]MCM1423371.1 FlxA-like family protein [bacterium]
MMMVSGVNGISAQPAAGAKAGEQTDPACRDLQQQIERLQQELKEVSANQEMPMEAKMKKRQELQRQISELQIQLRQRQMELKREEREKKKEESSFDDLLGTKQQNNANAAQNTGLSTDSMTAMISADKAAKQADVQGSTAKKMEGRANVLETEIKLDGARGGDTAGKQAELSDVKAAAQKAEASQLSTLAKAGEEMQDAAENGNSLPKTNSSHNSETKDDEEEKRDGEAAAAPDEEAADTEGAYHPIDVRL